MPKPSGAIPGSIGKNCAVARSDPRNSTQYWWDRHLTGLSLLNADFTTHEYPLHTHDALVVAMTEQGGSIVRSRGRIEEATPATLFVFNPEEPHGGRMGWSERWKYRSMYLTRLALEQLAQDLGVEEIPYFTRNVFTDRDLIDAFLAMHVAIEEGRDVFGERELLISSFGRLFQRHGSGARIEAAPRDLALFGRVRERMRAEYAHELHLDGLAAEVDLTTFQLIGLFKRAVGLTPQAQLPQVRPRQGLPHLRPARALGGIPTDRGFYD